MLQFAFAWLVTLGYSALPAAAQCAMCAQTVKGGGSRVIEVIKVGIYIMLIPTVLIFGFIALMVYRRRKHPLAEVTAAAPDSLPAPLPEFPSSAR